MSRSIWIGIVFVFYLITMLWIGMFFFRKASSSRDYFLGARGLNKWVAALSAQASDMSGWLLLGVPGLAYLSGVGEAFWVAFGLAAGTYLNWKFVAKRLRVYTQVSGDSVTLPDFFESRFRDSTKILRAVSAVIILIFFLLYTSAQFAAGAKLFQTVFGIPYTAGLIVGALVILSYTFLGGFLAVCWTDLIQGTLMFFALVIVPVVGVLLLGGFGPTETKILAVDSGFLNILMAPGAKPLTAITIISSLAWGLGYFGMPHILVRFMAIKHANEIKHSRVIAMIWVLITLSAAICIGVIGRVLLPEVLEGSTSEKVFMLMVNRMFPAVVAGILLAAILAAVMSTADSQLLVTASAISHDFYRTIFKKSASDKEMLWVGRITVVGVSVVAFLLALDPNSSVFGLVSYAWAGFGAAFGPVVLLGLFWKRTTLKGAAMGMIVGGITVIVWKQLSGGLFDLYELFPGFVFSLAAGILFSLLDKVPSPEITEEFEEVKKLLARQESWILPQPFRLRQTRIPSLIHPLKTRYGKQRRV